MSKHWYWLKYFLVSSLSLLIILSGAEMGRTRIPTPSVPAWAVNTQAQQAQLLTQKGHRQLNLGFAAVSLQTWQEATKIYQQLGNHQGVTGSLINQSMALQAEGLYPRACKTLIQALELESWLCEPIGQDQLNLKKPRTPLAEVLKQKSNTPIVVTGFQSLGDVLRQIGKPDESDLVLQQALLMAKSQKLSRDIDDILLSLANTQTTLYRRAQDRYQITEEPLAKDKLQQLAQDKASVALKLYQQVATKQQSGKALQAQLNQLRLLLELEQWTASEAKTNSVLKTLHNTIQKQIRPLVKPLLAANFSQLTVLASVYAQLNLADNLVQISQKVELRQSLFPPGENSLLVGLQIAQSARQTARSLDNKRAESYADGTIGKIYTHLAQTERSKQYLEKALGLAQSLQAWDLAYQWQQQLGRLYQQQGKLDKATKIYGAAVDSLERVRGNILSANPDLQFSFKEKVEPIYQEYLRLLLAAPTPNLELVIQTNERLQLAELENFLQCGRLNLISLNDVQNVTLPEVIHILNLTDRVEVIVRSSNGSVHRHTPDYKLVKRNVDNLLLNLQDERFLYTDERIILSYSQALYNLLIAPIKSYLPLSGTLMFVVDSSFQGLPMGLLYDGQDYLLKKYSIAVALNSQLQQPQLLQPSDLRALIAGISKKSPSFNAPNAPKDLTPLLEVETEVADIRANTVTAVELLDEEFTSQRFQTEMSNVDFPIVHITTHGQFSSDPEQTVILAWDRTINVKQMNSLLRNKNSQEVIELLVLSACQTAKGDKRSALGIAGVAAQAGARSTVATLWLVEAQSTAKLMDKFYLGLKRGQGKAEALRQAQLSLLSNPKYHHPYYWSPFILVGSWL
jgi:CHAT domain-containing protein